MSFDTKTAEQWSEQMVRIDRVETQARLLVRFGDESLVLGSIPSEPAENVTGLQQQVESLRRIIAAALQSYAAGRDGEPTRPVAALPAAPQPGNSIPGNGSPRLRQTAEIAERPKPRRTLAGLPCPACGSCYDSQLQECPFCRKRAARGAESTAASTGLALLKRNQSQLEEEDRPSEALAPNDLRILRTCIHELMEAGTRFAGGLARAQEALRVTPDEAGKIMYDTVFPEASVTEPWETCADSFRHGYSIRAGALLGELRRRAGIDEQPERRLSVLEFLEASSGSEEPQLVHG